MASQNLVNIGLDKGLLSGGTKLFPEPTLSNHHSGIHLGAISLEMLKVFIPKMALKKTDWRSRPHLPGTHELKKRNFLRKSNTWCCAGGFAVAGSADQI